MPAPKLHEASQQLSLAVDAQTGELTRGWTKDEVSEVVREATAEFWASDLGQQLLERGGDGIEGEVISIMEHRYEHTNFALCPFVESLTRVGQDLLQSLPKPAAPKVEPAPKVAPVISHEEKEKLKAQEEAEKKYESKVKQFSHMVSRQLNTRGVNSLKPRFGAVNVVAENGQVYEYPVADFDKLYTDAVNLGFLTGSLL
jgi:hypothetical protein